LHHFSNNRQLRERHGIRNLRLEDQGLIRAGMAITGRDDSECWDRRRSRGGRGGDPRTSRVEIRGSRPRRIWEVCVTRGPRSAGKPQEARWQLQGISSSTEAMTLAGRVRGRWSDRYLRRNPERDGVRPESNEPVFAVDARISGACRPKFPEKFVASAGRRKTRFQWLAIEMRKRKTGGACGHRPATGTPVLRKECEKDFQFEICRPPWEESCVVGVGIHEITLWQRVFCRQVHRRSVDVGRQTVLPCKRRVQPGDAR